MDNGASSYRRFLKGDDTGLCEIINEYNKGLTLYLNSFVNNLTTADDLSEDTFVKIGLKKPHFSGKSSFKTWLYAIGRNIALDYLRKSSKISVVSIDECEEQRDVNAFEKDCLKEEQKEIVHKTMKNLKSEYRQILWLIYFEELSTKETAEVMKKSVHNIESTLSRARKALKSELAGKGYSYENL